MARPNNKKKNSNNGGYKNGSGNGKGSRSRTDEVARKESSANSENAGRNEKETSSQTESTKTEEVNKKGSSTNDPEWYSKFPSLVLDTASIPFSNPFGAPVKSITNRGSFVPDSNVYVNSLAHFEAIAGLMAIRIKPTIGYSDGLYDAPNVAANAMYSFIRILNNGRKNYEVPDLMMYNMALTDIYSAIIFAERIYALGFLYSQKNWYIGRRCIKACGIDPDDLVNNLANFREAIKILISKVAAYKIPGDINLLRRRVFMYSSLYIENDAGISKDQMYMFVPDGFYHFDLDAAGKGCLKYKRYTPGNDGDLITCMDLIDYIHSLLNNIYGDEDFAIMSGDIMRSYGENVMGLPPMPDDFLVVPTYDPDVLYQIHNLTIAASVSRDDILPDQVYTHDDETMRYGNVYQDRHGVICCREFSQALIAGDSMTTKVNELELCSQRILDSDKPEPTAVDVMESTRLQVCAKRAVRYQDTDVVIGYELITGCDIATGIFVYYNYEGVDGMVEDRAAYSSNFYPVLGDTSLNVAQLRILDFAYGPIMQFTSFDNVDYDVVVHKLIGNLRNLTVYDNKQLQRMHEVALLSLFWVPGIAVQI